MKISDQIRRDIRNNWKPVLACVAFLALMILLFGGCCPLRLLTGIPCPGCGMSRALLLVLTLRFQEAWAFQPLVYFWIAFGLFWCLNRYGLHKSSKVVRGILLCLLLFTIGWYVYKMVTLYPRESPYIYYENNLVGRALKALGVW